MATHVENVQFMIYKTTKIPNRIRENSYTIRATAQYNPPQTSPQQILEIAKLRASPENRDEPRAVISAGISRLKILVARTRTTTHILQEATKYRRPFSEFALSLPGAWTCIFTRAKGYIAAKNFAPRG